MARDKTTYIMLDRNIMQWRWYKNPNTFRVFIHLLLNANIAPHDFEDITVERGSLVTSHERIAESLSISIKSVRTALTNLVKTGEIEIKRHSHFLEISMVRYSFYQGVGNQRAIKGQSFGNQKAIKGQQLNNNKNGNNGNKLNNNSPHTHKLNNLIKADNPEMRDSVGGGASQSSSAEREEFVKSLKTFGGGFRYDG